jgi:hypothetical protein
MEILHGIGTIYCGKALSLKEILGLDSNALTGADAYKPLQ